jgi:hypothetical protein
MFGGEFKLLAPQCKSLQSPVTVSPLEPSILVGTLFPNTLIELRGRVINIPASCLGAPGFKSQPDDRLS